MRDIDRINKLRTEIERLGNTISKINQRLYKLECPHIAKDIKIVSTSIGGYWQESCRRCGRVFTLMDEDGMLKSEEIRLKTELEDIIMKIKQTKEDQS